MEVSAKKTPAIAALHRQQVAQAFRGMLLGLRQRSEERRMRRRIDSLDDHMLRDIGLLPKKGRPSARRGHVPAPTLHAGRQSYAMTPTPYDRA